LIAPLAAKRFRELFNVASGNPCQAERFGGSQSKLSTRADRVTEEPFPQLGLNRESRQSALDLG
jgi:hypothetical protein